MSHYTTSQRNGIDRYGLREIHAGLDRIAEIADNKGD